MAGETFRRNARLVGPEAFTSLLRAKRHARGETFLVQIAANGRRRARLGMVLSKRVIPRAVDRSLLKRLIRESFRRQQKDLAGLDVLVRSRRVLPRKESAAARQELRALFRAAAR